jgi:NAD(P)-dependent dehydrogenase (short-subunit alcohol dehydrogenase family)
MKLDGTIVCVVTGGASGLGLAAAKALLEKGCKVVIADFNKVHLKNLINHSGRRRKDCC